MSADPARDLLFNQDPEIEPEVTYGYHEEIVDSDLEGARVARQWFLDRFSPHAEFIFV